MRLIIDRFDGDYAVCEKEDGSTTDIKKNLIPQGAAEGDVLRFDGKSYLIDKAETQKRRKEIEKLAAEVFGDEEG